MRSLLRFLTREWVLVSVLVLMGGILRFAYFPLTLAWTNDIARDMLVAWQAVELDRWPMVGHFNTGTQDYYQPYYFYFLSALVRIGGAPEFLYALFILAHTLSLVGIYLVAKNLFNKQAGFIALLICVGSNSLLGAAHYPTAAPWSWPLYVLSLTLVSIWQQQKKLIYLWLAAAVSFIALQVHGSQLVFLGLILFLIGRQKLSQGGFFMWLGTCVMVLLNQHDLVAAVFKQGEGASTGFRWQNFIAIGEMLRDMAFVEVRFFILFVGLLVGLIAWCLWRKQRPFSDEKTHWVLYALYVGLFEGMLGLLKTGALPHHQEYMIVVMFILLAGFVGSLALPTRKIVAVGWKILLVGLLVFATWTRVLAVEKNDSGFFHVQRLYQTMKAQNLPLKTATVMMTDVNADMLSNTSSNTELWWFLMTDLGRRDLGSEIWVVDQYAQELVLVCDELLSEIFAVPCVDQITAVVAETHKNYVLQKSLVLEENFRVNLYQQEPSMSLPGEMLK